MIVYFSSVIYIPATVLFHFCLWPYNRYRWNIFNAFSSYCSYQVLCWVFYLSENQTYVNIYHLNNLCLAIFCRLFNSCIPVFQVLHSCTSFSRVFVPVIIIIFKPQCSVSLPLKEDLRNRVQSLVWKAVFWIYTKS